MAEPAPVQTHPAPAARLFAISLAYFMVLLDTTVLAVAEPTMITGLHTDVVGVGWATTIYTMTLASTLVLAGTVADRCGAHPTFVVGVIGFGVASLACALSPDLSVLLAARGLLGVSAAATVPASLGLIAALYPDPPGRARAISVWATVSGAAVAAGPVLGGWLITVGGWRAVFLVNVPLALIVLVACRRSIPTQRHSVPLAWLPHLGLAGTLASATLAITDVGGGSWVGAVVFGLVAVILGCVTAMIDRGSLAPLVPRELRRNRDVRMTFGWGAIVNYGLTTVIFSVPLLLGGDALTTGAVLLPMTLLVAVNPLVTGRLVVRFGATVPIRMGLGAFPVGLGLTAYGIGDQRTPFLLGVGLALCGLGVSWSLPALVGFAVHHAPSGSAGSVGGLLNASRQVGATTAAAIASAVLVRPDPHHVVPFAVAAALSLLGLAGSVHLGRSGPTK